MPALLVSAIALATAVYILPFHLFPLSLVASNATPFTMADRIQAINNLRGLAIQTIAGAALFLGIIYTAQTLRVTHNTFDLNRQGQRIEQFSRAVDQLGQSGFDKTDVRAGEIYSLGMLIDQAHHDDSKEVRGLRLTIIRTVESYLFQHDYRGYATLPSQNRGTPGGAVLDADFQAAVTILSGTAPMNGDEPLRLFGLELGGADLREAHLEGALLGGANLEQADLRGAHLKGGDLRGACLRSTLVDARELALSIMDNTTVTDASGGKCGRAA